MTEAPSGFQLVTENDFVPGKSFAVFYSPDMPLDLEESLFPHYDHQWKLYSKGPWEEASEYFVIAALPTTRAIACYVIRRAAEQGDVPSGDAPAFESPHRHDDGVDESELEMRYRVPSSQDPERPIFVSRTVQETTALVRFPQKRTNLGRVMWLTPGPVLIQVAAENMFAEEMLSLAEHVEIRRRPANNLVTTFRRRASDRDRRV